MARNLRKLLVLGLGLAACAGLVLAACQSYELEEVTPRAFGAVKQPIPITGKMLPPYIMLVVDKSGSMNQQVPNSTATKWQELISAFANPATGFLPQSRDLARFGLALFPTDVQGSVGCDPGTVLVPLDPTNNKVDEVMAELNGSAPLGGTPISVTLDAAAQDPRLSTAEPGRLRFVMLLTDGLPNCNASAENNQRCLDCNADLSSCEDQSRNGCFPTNGPASDGCQIFDQDNVGLDCLDDKSTVAAITRLRDMGVETFVIGFGRETAVGTVGSRVLNAAAEAGGRARQNSETGYYQTGNRAELQAALADIIHQTQQCIFQLDPPPTSANVVQVKLYDSQDQSETVLQRDAEWTISEDLKSLEVIGDRCTLIQTAPPDRYELRFYYASQM